MDTLALIVYTGLIWMFAVLFVRDIKRREPDMLLAISLSAMLTGLPVMVGADFGIWFYIHLFTTLHLTFCTIALHRLGSTTLYDFIPLIVAVLFWPAHFYVTYDSVTGTPFQTYL